RLRLAQGSPKTRLRLRGARSSEIHAIAELGPREELVLELSYEPSINGERMCAPGLDGLSPLPRPVPSVPEGSLRGGSSSPALSALYRWSGDPGLLERHGPTIGRCCQWILERLERDGGLIYYAPAKPGIEGENRHQAWKDSGDAIVDEHGRIRTPPLALVEIQ